MKPQKYTRHIIVPPDAIDALNHVNNIAYLQWCLDVAEAHWIDRTEVHLREKYVWVVLEHAISYKAPSFLGEELEIGTWIHSYKGVRSERHYTITRPADGKLIVEAKTNWCLVDAETHRPTKIPESIAKLFS